MARLPKHFGRVAAGCVAGVLVGTGLSFVSLEGAGSGAAAGSHDGAARYRGAGADSRANVDRNGQVNGGNLAGGAKPGGTPGGGTPGGAKSGSGTPGIGSTSGGTSGSGSSGGGTPIPVAAAPQGLWQSLPPDLQSTVSNFAADQGAAGVAVGIATARGRFLSLNGYADVDNETFLQGTDLFAYRSITKTFVGTVILQLVAEGKLRLDDPVSDYVASVPSGDTISVRMALEMRTGLAEYSDTQDFSDQMNSGDEYIWTDADLLADSFAQPLVFDPGTDFGYSNTNTVLLGTIIRVLTGQTWDQQVRTRLLDPLHLTSIVYPPNAALGAVLEPPEDTSADGPSGLQPPSDTLYSAAGGLFGDIGDLLSWGTELGSGTLLPSDLQAARMTSVSDPQNSDFTPSYDGYGLALGELDGWWGHTGVGFGYESLVMYDPVRKATVAILINTALADPNAAADLFRELVPQLGRL
ncbi:serine hydrolase domain-containing protein [Arthrobacter sp. A5]|uniref:serine hydrolase domain-containing protein n=1 Tax=Arthrobacter sp. A5 TaxID=576926 RepID=UPI003DA8238B